VALDAPVSEPAMAGGCLPELGAVYWRARVDRIWLRRRGRLWTATTAAHTVPFIAAAVALGLANPVTVPVGVILIAHAWIIPELYASRGAGVTRVPRSNRARLPASAQARALGLLGDLVGPEARDLVRETGLVLERGRLGNWLIGEQGGILVAPSGRRVWCFCVHASDPELPTGDRIAHLLLALREDESGFATVANLVFSGARWRLRRRLDASRRPALERARQAGRQV
jgi:hypothetical protein